MSDELEFTDKAGHQLKRGDYIVYGHALGRCAGLQYAVVIEIVKEKASSYSSRNKKNKLRIQAVDTDWGTSRKPRLLTRKSLIEFPDRIIRLNRDQVRKDALEVLDTVKLD